MEVVGIDASPLAVDVAQERGVRDACVLSVASIRSELGRFDTFLLLGNNFGVFGSVRGARATLRKLGRLARPEARIIAAAASPYAQSDPHELAYQSWNRARGRMPGQMRVRVRYTYYTSAWFDWLFVSREELDEIVRGTGWRVSATLEGPIPNFIVVLEPLKRGLEVFAKPDRG
jgi:SAM-dependent methyltransferase